jgi:hypothetical protein
VSKSKEVPPSRKKFRSRTRLLKDLQDLRRIVLTLPPSRTRTRVRKGLMVLGRRLDRAFRYMHRELGWSKSHTWTRPDASAAPRHKGRLLPYRQKVS